MQRRWNADQALELIERERITTAGGVPTIAWQIIEHPRFHEFDLSSLETISYGGAPSAPELVRRMKERFPNLKPGQGWGMTETSATATSNFGEDYERKPTSCGVPSPTGEVRIVGDKGQDMPVGEVGELYYRGPIVVRGYWNKPQATAETFVDGWVKTGDLARVDEEGFVYIVDRAKDMLIRGGENIYCVEVENALYDHPAVMDAAVIGIAASYAGRGTGRGRASEIRRACNRGRVAAFRGAEDCGVQSAGEDFVPARDSAAQRERQDHEEGSEAFVRGVSAMLSWRVGDVKITKIVEVEVDRQHEVRPAAGDARGGARDRLAGAAFHERRRAFEDEHPCARHRDADAADDRRHVFGQRQARARRAVVERAIGAVPARSCRRGFRARVHRYGDVHASACRSCRVEYDAGRRQMGPDVSERALSDGARRVRLLARSASPGRTARGVLGFRAAGVRRGAGRSRRDRSPHFARGQFRADLGAHAGARQRADFIARAKRR